MVGIKRKASVVLCCVRQQKALAVQFKACSCYMLCSLNVQTLARPTMRPTLARPTMRPTLARSIAWH